VARPVSAAILDVDYGEGVARAAALVATDLGDAESEHERVIELAHLAPYEPGSFYRRELPCLLAVLERLPPPRPELLVIDGYVWLDAAGTKGLGAHLSDALGGARVIGVAKTAYRGAAFAARVLRGTSQSPLFVTSVGIEPSEAAALVAAMHGPHRIPTLLRRVDQLARSLVAPRVDRG